MYTVLFGCQMLHNLQKPIKKKYVAFIDCVICTDLPDHNVEPELHSLVSQYQVHAHSNSCRKYKNVPCRFNYGRFFTDKTIIAEPVSG